MSGGLPIKSIRVLIRQVVNNGGEPIMSQRESIERYGHSDDVDKTMAEIAAQKVADVFEPTM